MCPTWLTYFVLTNASSFSACSTHVHHIAGYTISWQILPLAFWYSVDTFSVFGSTLSVLSVLIGMAGQRLRASLLVMHVLCALLTSAILPPLVLLCLVSMSPLPWLSGLPTLSCALLICLLPSFPVESIITPLVSLQ